MSWMNLSLEGIEVSYSAQEDVYIIAFQDERLFPDPVQDTPHIPPHLQPWHNIDRWAMFTHGVCALRCGRGLYMRQLALTGWHLPEPPTESHFACLLVRAADKMERMARESLTYNPQSEWGHQNEYAAGELRRQQQGIIRALMTARQIADGSH
jgi:hypothetical protein